MTDQTMKDPWDSAENAKEPVFSNIIWGQVEAQSWYCVLEKGVGKVVFDAQTHSADQRRTAIDIIVHPLPEMNLTFDLARNMIAESHEWASVVLPSLRDLGVSPKSLDGAWVKVQTISLTDRTGNTITYTDNNGVVKEKTTLKFLTVFPGETECRADFEKEHVGNGQAKPVQASANGTSGNGSVNKERETAWTFLKIFVKDICKEQNNLEAIRAALGEKIANQPLIGKYFTVDSPEVVQFIAENTVQF